jgi:hypothetical protein
MHLLRAPKRWRACSRFTMARFSNGWNSTREEPRDAKTIVHELHSLLDQAGVKRSYVDADESEHFIV